MKINAKHKAFVDAYVTYGFNGRIAYQKVYPVDDATAIVNASRLLTNADIRKLLEEKQAEIAERANIKKENILTKLMEIAYGEETKPGDAIRALNEINRMLGYSSDKVEHSGEMTNNIIKVKFKKPDEDDGN